MLEDLDKALHLIDASLHSLTDKLGPLLLPESPTAEAARAEEPARSQMHEATDTAIRYLNVIAQKVDCLRERVDIPA